VRAVDWFRSAALALTLLTWPAAAQTTESPSAGEVIWLLRPAVGRIPDGATRISLSVDLRCTIRAGKLTACAAVEREPEGFAQAAIEAAGRAHIAAEDTIGAPTEGREIVVAIGFPIPVAIDPPPAPPSGRVLTGLTWLEQPDVSDFARLYPERAKQENVSGRVTLDCLVSADGRLSCTVISEDPPGFGFAEATLRIAREFRIAPQTQDGVATAGGRIRRTIRWVIS
jgi:TonB family protein